MTTTRAAGSATPLCTEYTVVVVLEAQSKFAARRTCTLHYPTHYKTAHHERGRRYVEGPLDSVWDTNFSNRSRMFVMASSWTCK
jgi:hypothetical protein